MNFVNSTSAECINSTTVMNITVNSTTGVLTLGTSPYLSPACISVCLNTAINPFDIDDMIVAVFDEGVNQLI